MTCCECQDRPGPGGMVFSDRSAAGICRHCGRGVCRDHGVWAEASREPDYGRRVAEGLGIALWEVPAPPQAAEVAVGV